MDLNIKIDNYCVNLFSEGKNSKITSSNSNLAEGDDDFLRNVEQFEAFMENIVSYADMYAYFDGIKGFNEDERTNFGSCLIFCLFQFGRKRRIVLKFLKEYFLSLLTSLLSVTSRICRDEEDSDEESIPEQPSLFVEKAVFLDEEIEPKIQLFQQLYILFSHPASPFPYILFDSISEIIHAKVVFHCERYSDDEEEGEDMEGRRSMFDELMNWSSSSLISHILSLTSSQSSSSNNDTFTYENMNNLIKFMVCKSFIHVRCSQLFDITTDFPDSFPKLLELKSLFLVYSEIMSDTKNDNKSHNCVNLWIKDQYEEEISYQNDTILTTKLSKEYSCQISKRLLHSGASTKQILSILLLICQVCQVLDPASGRLMRVISGPVREYLRERNDSMMVIVADLIQEAISSKKSDKQRMDEEEEEEEDETSYFGLYQELKEHVSFHGKSSKKSGGNWRDDDCSDFGDDPLETNEEEWDNFILAGPQPFSFHKLPESNNLSKEDIDAKTEEIGYLLNDIWKPDPKGEFIPVFHGDDEGINQNSNNTISLFDILLSIHNSPSYFLREYQQQLGSRLLHNFSYEIDKEIELLEFLKVKFGSTSHEMTCCEIMIKDVEDSRRINTLVHAQIEKEVENCEETVIPSLTLLSHEYWPPLPPSPDISHESRFIADHFTRVSDSYHELKNPRIIEWNLGMGCTDIELDFGEDDGGVQIFEGVSPLHISYLYLFQENSKVYIFHFQIHKI